eukprot:evm.model.NODE_1479_length_7697_cov_17.574900.2
MSSHDAATSAAAAQEGTRPPPPAQGNDSRTAAGTAGIAGASPAGGEGGEDETHQKRYAEGDDDDQGQGQCTTPSGPYRSAGVLGQQRKAVSSLKFSGNGQLLAAASADTTITIWDPIKRTQVRELKGGHTHGVSDVAWARDSSYLATGADDKTIRIWDTETGQEVGKMQGHTGYVFCVAFNPQGSLLASGSGDENVKLWDLRTGGCLKTLEAHAEPVTGVDFNGEGTCLVSGSFDGLVRLWDVGMGQCLKTMFAEGSPAVSCVKWAPNGEYVLVSSLDSMVRLWGVKSPSRVVRTYRGHRNERLCVSAMFVSWQEQGKHRHKQRQQQCMVSGSEDGKVYLWDVKTGKVMQTLGGHKAAVLSLAAHPSQGVLASGGTSGDGVIRLWCTEEWAKGGLIERSGGGGGDGGGGGGGGEGSGVEMELGSAS